MKALVIIPCYNEEKSIVNTVKKIEDTKTKDIPADTIYFKNSLYFFIRSNIFSIINYLFSFLVF